MYVNVINGHRRVSIVWAESEALNQVLMLFTPIVLGVRGMRHDTGLVLGIELESRSMDVGWMNQCSSQILSHWLDISAPLHTFARSAFSGSHILTWASVRWGIADGRGQMAGLEGTKNGPFRNGGAQGQDPTESHVLGKWNQHEGGAGDPI